MCNVIHCTSIVIAWKYYIVLLVITIYTTLFYEWYTDNIKAKLYFRLSVDIVLNGVHRFISYYSGNLYEIHTYQVESLLIVILDTLSQKKIEVY